MTAEEIGRFAAAGKMPDVKMTCPEKCLFYELRDLYAMHKENRLTKADGERMKNESLKEFKKNVEELNCSKALLRHEANMWQKIEMTAMAYRKEPTIEHADAFIEAVYGVGRRKLPQEEEEKETAV